MKNYSMTIARIIIKDEVNVRIKGLDPDTHDLVQDRLAFYVPGYIHMPAYKLQRWDGKIRLYKASGTTYLNLLEYIFPIIEQHGYDVEVEDNREDYTDITDSLAFIASDFLKGYFIDGEPAVVRDYQVDAVNKCLAEGSGILELATGSGKTLICAILSRLYSMLGNRVVVIVPNIDLLLQTQHWFKNFGVDAGIWYGGIKERKIVTIATWQSLDHFPELFAGVKCVIVDEVHQAKAKVLNEMLTGPAAHVPFRFGCSGTIPKEEIFRYQIEGAVGKIIFTLRAWELQEQGVLANSNIYQFCLEDTKNKTYAGMSETHDDWFDEVNWMFGQKQRVEYIADMIQNIAVEKGNTLVLVQYRKHGKVLAAAIPGSLSLDGRDKGRLEHYKEFNDTDNNVLICTFGIASKGIDIPRIFNLVMIEPGKKFEKVNQILGRGFRKAKDKTHLNVYDIFGNVGLSTKHAARRRTLYREAKQPFEQVKVNYVSTNSK